MHICPLRSTEQRKHVILFSLGLDLMKRQVGIVTVCAHLHKCETQKIVGRHECEWVCLHKRRSEPAMLCYPTTACTLLPITLTNHLKSRGNEIEKGLKQCTSFLFLTSETPPLCLLLFLHAKYRIFTSLIYQFLVAFN